MAEFSSPPQKIDRVIRKIWHIWTRPLVRFMKKGMFLLTPISGLAFNWSPVLALGPKEKCSGQTGNGGSAVSQTCWGDCPSSIGSSLISSLTSDSSLTSGSPFSCSFSLRSFSLRSRLSRSLRIRLSSSVSFRLDELLPWLLWRLREKERDHENTNLTGRLQFLMNLIFLVNDGSEPSHKSTQENPKKSLQMPKRLS